MKTLVHALLLVLGFFGQALCGHAYASEIQVLSQTQFCLQDSAQPPNDQAEWRSQALPDAWTNDHPLVQKQGQTSAWYRFHFQTPATNHSPLAIYLPKQGLNAAVYVNGQFIGDGGSFTEPVGRNWNRPLLFPIPPEHLSDGDNVLHIRLLSHPYTQANLSPVQIGPERLLRETFDRITFIRVSLNQTATLLILGIAVLMLSLWWQRRQDVAYGYFGLSALVWAAQSTNLYVRAVPVDTATWEILINSSFQVFSAFLLISLLRFSNAGGKPLIPLLWFSLLVSPLSLALVPAPYFLTLTTFWHVYTLLSALATLLFLLRAAIRWKNRDAALISASMGLVVVLAAHDWFMHSQHFWQNDSKYFTEDLYLLHYSAPLIFLALGLIMTTRFVRVLNEFEQLNNELETRVQQKHQALQESNDLMRGLEREQAVSDERERIYRDLHDDVGAKLLSLVYRSSNTENQALARSALQDLRDVVSATQHDQLSLGAACANWRAECEQRLSEADILLDWQQQGLFEALLLTQPQVLNLGRILREAVSNIIKHAQARNAQIHIESNLDGVNLLISDDGVGHPGASHKSTGLGLRNMESRARRIGATYQLETLNQGGTAISVHLPADQFTLGNTASNSDSRPG